MATNCHGAKLQIVQSGFVYQLEQPTTLQRTGSVDAKPPSQRSDLCKLDNHQLYIISMAIKDVTGTVVVLSTVCKLLGKYGFNRKKIQHIALQRNLSQRASFIANICYQKEMLVWVDETGCERQDFLRTYGYSFRGMRAECKRLLVRGKGYQQCAGTREFSMLKRHQIVSMVNYSVILLGVP